MAWETRNGKGRYYTRSRKEGGRVVRVYIGMGREAEAVAEADQRRREQLTQERLAHAQAAARFNAADDALNAFCASTDAQLQAALIEAGYHQHKRGEWRRRRGNGTGDSSGNNTGQ